MIENKFKIKSAKNKKPLSGKSMFAGLEKKLKLESYFEGGFNVCKQAIGSSPESEHPGLEGKS